MPKIKISSADYTAMNSIDQTSETQSTFRRAVTSAEQDTPGVKYTPEWSKWFGYYKSVPELQAVINKKAIWTLGSGYETDAKTEKIIKRIRGFGKDTFNDIMFNNSISNKIAIGKVVRLILYKKVTSIILLYY